MRQYVIMNKRHVYIGTGIVIVLLLVVVFYSSSIFSTGEAVKESSDLNSINLQGNPEKLTIYFFWGDGCPHCATQKPYLEEWQNKYGNDIEVKMFETWKNPENVPLFQEVAKAYGIEARGVPTTFIGEKHWVGFSSSMAPEMEEYIEYCIGNRCETPLTN